MLKVLQKSHATKFHTYLKNQKDISSRIQRQTQEYYPTNKWNAKTQLEHSSRLLQPRMFRCTFSVSASVWQDRWHSVCSTFCVPLCHPSINFEWTLPVSFSQKKIWTKHTSETIWKQFVLILWNMRVSLRPLTNTNSLKSINIRVMVKRLDTREYH